MELEPKSLNIKFPPTSYTWRSQRYIILASAVLSLMVVQPSSLMLGLSAVLIGTPLFWVIFGSNFVFKYTSGKPIVRFVVILVLVYCAAGLLALAAPWMAKLLVGIN